MIRIVMADDHRFFREGFAAMFEGHAEVVLLDQASDGRQLLAMVDKHRPDVVLTDIQMEPVDGFEVMRQMTARYPDIPVIALTMYFDDYSIGEMLNAGARGYLVKSAGEEIVEHAIKAAARGENYYCHTASRKISALISNGLYDPATGVTAEFNPTELRIIRFMCEDVDSKEMAEKLHISPITLKRYRQQIMEKAGVKSPAALIYYAMKRGWVRG